VVVLQEVKRYILLLGVIRRELEDLQKGIHGFLIMTADLGEVATCVYEGRVPPSWKRAYLSLKPLVGWIRDLNHRIDFFKEWAKG
jgi:dynein heavy chain